MPSLAELFPQNGIGSDLIDYRHYVLACQEKGKTPLSQQEWVKAGRPAG